MAERSPSEKIARRFLIRGRVQGVGFRYFTELAAHELGITGWVRNLGDGGVEVYAVGTKDQIDRFNGLLRRGPRWADVRGFEEQEAAVEAGSGFRIAG